MYGFSVGFLGTVGGDFVTRACYTAIKVMIKLQFIVPFHVNNLKTGEKVQD